MFLLFIWYFRLNINSVTLHAENIERPSYMSIATIITRSLGRHFHNKVSEEKQADAPVAFAVDSKLKAMTDAQLDVNDLHLSIGDHEILKGINLHIPEKQVTCIIGPSGCGKTTLLRTFNRLNDGTEGLKISGSITLGKEDIIKAQGKELTELRRNIGLVPQRPCPLPMDIYGNVAYGCRIHGIHNRKKLNAIVEHYLKAVGLWDEVKDRLHAPATSLSGGQQQRLCLARSLAVEPSVILADEATSALDPVSSQRIEDLFQSMKGSYTVVMVTHTLRQAMRIADYVVFMCDGKVVETGKAYDVFHNPKEKLTSDYLFGTFN